MKFHGRLNNTWLALPLAATVVLTACAPQAAQQTARNADVPAAVEQVQQAQMLPVGTFAGMVATFEDGRFVPVVGATVKVEGASGNAVTDAEGRYVFNGLKPGDYKVAVTKDGFSQGEGTVKLSPVAGTPRVNVAMNKPTYQLNQIAAFNATITGVVTDPRGAALPNATVRIATTAGTGTNQTVPANANGFYTVTIANMAVSPISPGYVQVTAFGTTPGGVKVEVDEVWAKPITSASLVVNARCDAFTRPQNITFPSGTFTPMGATNAAIDVEWMSTRADEFYLRLTSIHDTDPLNNPGQVFAILPESVTNTAAVGLTPQKCNIKFRVPFAFPPNHSTYALEIVPFGVTTAAVSDPTTKFVVNYTLLSFQNDIGYAAVAPHTTADGTKGAAEGGAVFDTANNGRFVSGEDVIYTLKMTNANLNVSPDLRVKGKVPAGTTIGNVKVTTTSGIAAPVVVNIPGANISQPNGTGDWSVIGFAIPAKVGANDGQCDVEVTFNSATTLAPGNTFDVTATAVEMPSTGYADTGVPAIANGDTLPTVTGIDRTQLTLVSKSIIEDIANDGVGLVTLVLRPTGTNAAGVYRFVDQTKVLVNSLAPQPARKATLNGSLGLAAAPTSIQLVGPGVTQDKIGLIVDEGLGGTEVVVSVASSGWDLETLCAFINGFVPGVTASRNAADNRIKIERTLAGTTRTVKIGPSTTNNMLQRLGLTAGQNDLGSNGITARYTAGTSMPVTPITQAGAGAATWTFATSSTSAQNADGSLTATFAIQPTNTAQAATPNGDITINYVIESQTPGPGLLIRLGGGLAAMGPRITAINQVAPFTVLSKDVAITSTATTKKDDAAATAGDI